MFCCVRLRLLIVFFLQKSDKLLEARNDEINKKYAKTARATVDEDATAIQNGER